MKFRVISLAAAILISLVQFATAGDSLIFVIRVDDIQSRINWEPRPITDFESAMEARGAKVSWAVIPHRLEESQNADGLLAEDLRISMAKGHEVVLHGYNHICTLCNQSSHEMYCTAYNQQLSYRVQGDLIRKGLAILEDSLGCVPTAFVPPGHQADTITYQVLLDHGMDIISTTTASKKNIFKTLYNLAPHNEYTWYLKNSNYQSQLNSALSDIDSRGTSDGYYCLLLHDPFIRKGYENGLVIDWTAELLDSLIARYGDKLQFMTVSEAAGHFNPEATAIASKNVKIPNHAKLSHNYPNPFNPSTTIEYYIPGKAQAQIRIFDMLGHCVRVYSDLKQGHGQVTWDGRDDSGRALAAGSYFYQLIGNDGLLRSGKMQLIK